MESSLAKINEQNRSIDRNGSLSIYIDENTNKDGAVFMCADSSVHREDMPGWLFSARIKGKVVS